VRELEQFRTGMSSFRGMIPAVDLSFIPDSLPWVAAQFPLIRGLPSNSDAQPREYRAE